MSDSLPPTPPSRAPNHDERRFETINSPCEWIEDYHPGGYHPVHLGDVFHDGRYKILRKLGDGAFSTVWLARDLKNSTYVALKILVSEISQSTRELQILRYIAKEAPGDGNRHITQLLDEFQHHGPNGVHTCLVFEPMGPSVNSMVEELPQFKPRRRGMKVRYPPWMAKRILKQALEGLDFLHKHGIAHGDFQPGNILFALENIDAKPEEELRQEENEKTQSTSPPVKRLDGKKDIWAPRYLCIAQPLTPFTPTRRVSPSNCLIWAAYLIETAYFFTDPPDKPVTPIGLRAPELILAEAGAARDNKTLDIWSFGCLVFELVTGQPLCCVPGSDFEDDEHLLILTEKLGALPNALFEQWKTASRYFTPDRKLFNSALGGVKEGEEPLILEERSMEESFDEAGPEIDEEEARKVKMLIRRILQYDPAKRPSAADILRDPWFSESNLSS